MNKIADRTIEEMVAGKIGEFCKKVCLNISNESILKGIESVVEQAKKIKVILSKTLAGLLKIPMTVIRCKCVDQIPIILEAKIILPFGKEPQDGRYKKKKEQNVKRVSLYRPPAFRHA